MTRQLLLLIWVLTKRFKQKLVQINDYSTAENSIAVMLFYLTIRTVLEIKGANLNESLHCQQNHQTEYFIHISVTYYNKKKKQQKKKFFFSRFNC